MIFFEGCVVVNVSLFVFNNKWSATHYQRLNINRSLCSLLMFNLIF